MITRRFTVFIEDPATGRWDRVIGTARGYTGQVQGRPVGLLELPADALEAALDAEWKNRLRRVAGQRVRELEAA